MQLALVAGEREPGGDVQQLVAHPFRFGFGELAIQSRAWVQTIRSCASITISTTFVHREPLERQLRKAGVLVVADAVLDAGALTVTALQDGDLGVGLVVRIAWKRYPSWSVNDSCAPGCGRSRRTITLAPVGQGDSSTRSVISTTCPFSRSDPS